MLPRWLCTVALVTLAQVAAQPKQDDNVFMNAMKNLLFGADPANASAHIAQPEMHPHTFHQYNAVARSNQPSGQSCTLPQQIGTGPYRIPRWYFNPARGRCELFYWSGCCGNGNNFQTFQSCQTVCEAPLNKCQQPLNIGIGNANLQRWYFNPLTQQCQQCVYRGLQGNENNFLSRQDCEGSCLVNPCKLGTPFRSQGVTVQCSAANPTVCPAGYYCHVGADMSTSVCCQALGPDPCMQALDRGVGNTQLSRWFWNAQGQCCQPFSYCGQRGTQNNFLSKQDCERTCYELDNPCALGEPQLNPDNRPVLCTAQQQNTCGASFWCHIGASSQTTLCCPGRVEGPEICQQPLAVGEGGASLARFYYDPTTMSCKPFTYQGRYGNQNNFLDLQSCEQTCPVFTNPCNQPIPLPPTTCSGPGTCGGSTWCHIGATPETTVCCPSEGNPCVLPLAPGTGNQFMDRWYFNQQSGTCQSFTYAGLHGNQNNFLTQQSCEEQCGPNPCFEGKPFAGVDGRAQTCSASANLNTCPLNHWCHIGSDMSTTVCCPGASTNVCNLPMSTGEGNARLDRFYFDQSTKQCRPFVYNGLKGNQNNFVTLRACQLACQPLDNPCIGQPATTAAGQVLFCSYTNRDQCPVNFWCHIGATPETTVCCPGATNPCSVPLAPGTGNSGLNRWYYNPDDRQCLPFQYNGKRGNQNNFQTQAECERTCPEELCLLSIDRGACGGRQTRYAFNRQTSQCVPFEYTGCGGNLNNFVTMADCMSTCGNVGF